MIRAVFLLWRPAIILAAGLLLSACGGSESNTAVVTTASPTIFYAHSVAFRNSTTFAWGYNANGQLGTGTSTNQAVPVAVSSGTGGSLTGMDGIAVGGTHNIAFQNISGGAVKGWGNNAWGQVGDGTETATSTPQDIKKDANTLLTGLKAIAAGANHSLGLHRDGTVWAWGYNGYGQLGINSNDVKSLFALQVVGNPEIAALPSDIRSIAAGGSHSLALDGFGRVWAWGYNGYGQLGDSTTTDRLAPVRVVFPEDVVVIAIAAGGSTSLAIDSTGQVWGWGYNRFGQTGQAPAAGDINAKQVQPAKVVLADFTATKISVGLDHCLALRADGTVWSWGYNGYGQLGRGVVESVPSKVANPEPAPVTPGGMGVVVDIRAIGHHSLATTADGKVWAWGMNSYNQLGDGTTGTRSEPRVVSTF